MDPAPAPPTVASTTRARSAAVVIIGNEVLSGKVVEQNAAFFIRELRALGLRLREVAFVEDDRAAIAEAVRRLCAAHDVVCTTGGIGPTHDDVTIDAIALALGREVVERPELVAIMARLLGARFTPGHRRMARVPAGAELLNGPKLPWPLVRVDNLWIFPGIPSLARAQFPALAQALGPGPPVYLGALRIVAEEAEICGELDRVVAHHREVEIGSYPAWEAGRWVLRLTVEGLRQAAVDAAWRALLETFGDHLEASDPVAPVSSTAPAPA